MPAPQEIQIQKLFISGDAFSASYADIFITSATRENRSLQNLVIIMDFPRGKFGDSQISDSIIRHAAKTFEASPHLTPELVLEAVLESLNLFLPELSGRRTRELLSSLNLLIALSDRGQIHFSQVGTIRALLVQENAISDVSESPEINPLKIFSHVTSGLLDPSNAMVFTTESLLDYVSEEKIKHLLLEYPPQVAARKLELLLAQVPSSVTFASVLIKFITELDSLAAQNEKAARVARVPYPARAMPVEGTASHEMQDAVMPGRRTRARKPVRVRVITGFLRHLWTYLALLTYAVRSLIALIVKMIRLLTSPALRKNEERNFILRNQAVAGTLREKLASMPRSRRISLYLLLAVCFVLAHALILRSQTQEIERIGTNYNETLLAVSGKKQAFENAIVYNDEKTAEQMLLDIETLLSGITPQHKEQEQRLASLLEENQRSLNKVRHITAVSSPLVYADLSTVQGARNIAVSSDGAVTVVSGENLYRISGDKPELVVQASQPIRGLVHGERIFLMTESESLLYRDGRDGSTLKSAVLAKAQDEKPTAAYVYGDNLYVLDAAQGAIFKHTSAGGQAGVTFRAGTVWMKNPELLSAANDLTIDGNIYVITKGGSILKLVRGERQDFEMPNLKPLLGARTKIYTLVDSDFLYILDADNKRIVILDKRGGIKDQYVSPRFDDLKDLAINPNEDALTVLSGSTLYLLAINK
ncbi:MAG: hypothetical protein HY460_02480 [Parcubacteria group bacterium]|nr:hypothetical protein [Parcubacteria group bacterium]